MTIVDSLKNLLKKFGGDPSALEENATSSDVIDAISNAYTDKEGTYTEVTPIGSEGTKIATITTNNTAHDIYAPKELPAVTSEDAGMVLSVNSEGAWAKANPPTELPDVTSADEGDVLGVNSSGEWAKVTLNNSYKYVKISPRNGLSLTITPGEDEDDPYDLYELSYTGYTASADGVTVHDEIATGIPVDYNTVVQIVDANMIFNFITPVMQKVKTFRLTGIGTYFSGVPFAMHIRDISSYGISEPFNGVAYISSMTAEKLTFKVYKDSVTPTT